MDHIECGGASGALEVDSDGIGTARFTGLLMPSNCRALGALTMTAAVTQGARGLLYRNDSAAVCCDPASMTAGYPTLAARLRAVPVAFVVNAGQAGLYAQVVRRAGAAGLMRKMFYDPHDARAWLADTLRLLEHNGAWWAARNEAPRIADFGRPTRITK